MKKTFYLVSKQFKIIALILTCVVISFIIFLVSKNDKSYYLPIILLGILAFLAIIINFFTFSMRITVDKSKNIVRIKSVRSYSVVASEITNIFIDTEFSNNPKKYCFIMIETKEGILVQVPGFIGLKSNNNTSNSEKLTKEILSFLK